MAKKTKPNECPIPLEVLLENHNIAISAYSGVQRKMVALDSVDKGKLWAAIRAKFPKYQILPDTNWVRYVKNNIVSSIYTVGKSASILPTSEDDRGPVENLNFLLEYLWDSCDIASFQLQAGSSAALFNIGITQVGWDADARTDYGDKTFIGNVVLKNISPLRFMRDPYATDLAHAAYCMTWDMQHKTIIERDSRYKEAFKEFVAIERAAAAAQSLPIIEEARDIPKDTSRDGYYNVYIHFVRYTDEDSGESKIAEVHTIDNRHILHHNPDVRPSEFPFIELYCNLPEGDVVGVSEPAAILSNNIAYNIMNSILLTTEYKNQRPPRFINSSSGLNLRTFTKYGNEADYAFLVQGDASRAVHYQQFPAPSNIAQALNMGLAADVQTITGVDGRYTGRDTGSVLTTGGIEDMLTRVTLIDTPKIANYEKYTKMLTKLILLNFMEFSMERKYVRQVPGTERYEEIIIKFDELKKRSFEHYSLNISSELPKNKQRVAAMANTLIEKQMQYAGNSQGPELITPEEWLQLQDLPFKEMMSKRMGIQRVSDMTSSFAEGLYEYAAFLKQGLSPDDAVVAVGENLNARQQGQEVPHVPPDPAELFGDMAADPNAAAALAGTGEGDPMLEAQLDPDLLGALGADMQAGMGGGDDSMLDMLSLMSEGQL